MPPSNLLGAYLEAYKTEYFKLPIISKHMRPGSAPKVKAKIRKVRRVAAKRGMF